MTRMFATVVPGMTPLVSPELGSLPGVQVTEAGFDGRSDLILFDVDRGFREGLRSLRTIEDLRACVRDGVLAAIIHFEGATGGTSTTGIGMKRFQAVNHRKFFERWKDVLATHRFNGELPEGKPFRERI